MNNIKVKNYEELTLETMTSKLEECKVEKRALLEDYVMDDIKTVVEAKMILEAKKLISKYVQEREQAELEILGLQEEIDMMSTYTGYESSDVRNDLEGQLMKAIIKYNVADGMVLVLND